MAAISWTYIQADANTILADGYEALKARPSVKAATIRDEFACNYLISLQGEARYVGEGQNAQARLRQQFSKGTSTFYKSYLKKAGAQHSSIGEFDVQVMPTTLGRKEIEEFGIIRLVAPLNKFQSARRDTQNSAERTGQSETGMWDIVQAQHERLLIEGADAVLSTGARSWFDCAPPSAPGVYVVQHKDRLIYIGESSDLGARHETHSEDTYFSALRRHIGTELLGYELQEVGGRKRSFTDDQDWKVTRILTECEAVFVPVLLGRYELEAALITALSPVLNRKGVPA